MYSLKEDIINFFFPSGKYLKYKEGQINVLLSAPHGGSIKPRDIPSRTWGNKGRDTYTRRLIQGLIEMRERRPFYIYSDIHRSKIDLNREIYEACQGNHKAEKIWYEWNDYLSIYQAQIRRRFGRGLYIDIHSHNNSNQFQIGYGLNVKNYRKVMDNKKITALSTLSPLYYKEEDQYEMLFGKYSFKYTLEKYGYSITVPTDDQQFLSGGRNIRQYSGGGIGALQIECPVSLLKYRLSDVALAINDCIEVFKERYTG